MDKFSQEALALHNFYRFKHNAPALSFCPNLQLSAQKWAEQLISTSGLSTSELAKEGSVGENLFRKRTTSSDIEAAAPASASAREVVDFWYTSVGKFNFRDGLNAGDAGAFTQLVWKRSREVGFGIARQDDQCVVVAHYNPPGNVIGHYLANVEPVSEVLETMKGKKRVEETLTFLAPSGEVTIKKSTKEYIDMRGNFVRSTKQVLVKPGSSTASTSGTKAGDSAQKNKEKERQKERTFRNKIESDGSSSDEDLNSQKDLDGFRREVLELHNKQRRTHNCPDLMPNRELDLLAQRWARKLSKMEKLVNSNARYKNDMLGENIASRRSNMTCDYNARELVQHWYDEHDKYNYNREPHSIEGVGNFTQLVWRGSRELGVGKHIHRDANGSKAVVVCYYYPAGNIKTQFLENVYPGKN